MIRRVVIIETSLEVLVSKAAEVQITCQKCFYAATVDAIDLYNIIFKRNRRRSPGQGIGMSLDGAKEILKCSKCGAGKPKLVAMEPWRMGL